MIVCIEPGGRSFSGLAAYLTHDADADTDERVGWTHTLNLANDHVPSAVSEMIWTARDAELLKMEAGIRAGGRQTEYSVKHVSLNWAPGEEPTREHMIETSEAFLRHMKWHERQTLLVAHEDKEYRHVHLMVNTIHPETGLKLDDNFEQRRAQAWALDYEREHGLRCENRLKDVREREESPTRPAWMAFREAQRNFEGEEKARAAQAPDFEIPPNNPGDIATQEWAALKALQRDERDSFFADGKLAFKEMRNDIFREVRGEFRERWADYYDAVKHGVADDELKPWKAELVDAQKQILDERRDAACDALRDQRKELYQELLLGQGEMREALRGRQRAGFESLDLMEEFRVDRSRYTVERAPDDRQEERDAETAREAVPDERRAFAATAESPSGMRSGAHIAGGLADGVFAIAGGLFEFLAGGESDHASRRRPEPQPTGPDPSAVAADEAARQATRDAEAEELRRRSEQWSRSQQ